MTGDMNFIYLVVAIFQSLIFIILASLTVLFLSIIIHLILRNFVPRQHEAIINFLTSLEPMPRYLLFLSFVLVTQKYTSPSEETLRLLWIVALLELPHTLRLTSPMLNQKSYFNPNHSLGFILKLCPSFFIYELMAGIFGYGITKSTPSLGIIAHGMFRSDQTTPFYYIAAVVLLAVILRSFAQERLKKSI